MRTIDFDYHLPEELIADRPLPDRAASRMLLVEHLQTGCAVHTGGLVQGLGNGVEEALGNVVTHTGAGAVDDNQTHGSHLHGQAQVGEDLVDQDHGQKAGEHTQDQHDVHQGLSALKAQTGEGVAHCQNEDRLEKSGGDAHQGGILKPVQEIGLSKQADVVIKAELFGEELAVHTTVIDLEGFHNKAEEGEQPDQGDQDQDDIDGGVGDPSASLGAQAGPPDGRRSILCGHWKSSSFLVDGITL